MIRRLASGSVLVVLALFGSLKPAAAGVLPLDWAWFEGGPDSWRNLPYGFYGKDVIGNYSTAPGDDRTFHGFL